MSLGVTRNVDRGPYRDYLLHPTRAFMQDTWPLIGGRCRTNAGGLNGVGGGSEACKESLFFGAQAGTCRQALNIVGLMIRTPQKKETPQVKETSRSARAATCALQVTLSIRLCNSRYFSLKLRQTDAFNYTAQIIDRNW